MESKVAVFNGVDYFNRPIFKHKETGEYYCLVDTLMGAILPTQAELDEAVKREGVTFKGYDFDDEPSHRVENVILRMQKG